MNDESNLASELIAAMDVVLAEYGLYVSNTNGLIRHGDERSFAVDIDEIRECPSPHCASCEAGLPMPH